MSIAASTIIGGPAFVTWQGAAFYVEGNVRVDYEPVLLERRVAGFGAIGTQTMDVLARIRFTPSDDVTALSPGAASLWPYVDGGDWRIGKRIFGDTDKTLVVQSITEAQTYTFERCAITRMPPIRLGPGKIVGEVEFTALVDDGDALSATNIASFGTSAFAGTYAGQTFNELTAEVSWGDTSGFQGFSVKDFVNITGEVQLEPVRVGNVTRDMRLLNVRARASFVPMGLSHAQVRQIASLGSMGAGGQTLTTEEWLFAAGSELSITFPKGKVVRPSWIFSERDEFGLLEVEAERGITAGVLDDLVVLSVA